MSRFIIHWLGLDSASGHIYLALSGIIGDLALLGAVVTIYRKHNCHVAWCPRIGRHPVTGTPFVTCRRHHPHDAPTNQDVLDAHERALRQAMPGV